MGHSREASGHIYQPSRENSKSLLIGLTAKISQFLNSHHVPTAEALQLEPAIAVVVFGNIVGVHGPQQRSLWAHLPALKGPLYVLLGRLDCQNITKLAPSSCTNS